MCFITKFSGLKIGPKPLIFNFKGGLYCRKDVAQPYCEDVNECDPTNPAKHLYPGLAYCG